MDQAQWLERIEQGKARVASLRARLAAGESEASAAKAEGFHTQRSFDEACADAFARANGR